MSTRTRYMPMWTAALVTIGVVLTLPVWIPVFIVLDVVRHRRMRKVAEAFACVNCGRTLGDEALKRANEVWLQEMRERSHKYPGARDRIVRTLHAICPSCGTRYTFRENERTFVIEGRWPPAAPDGAGASP